MSNKSYPIHAEQHGSYPWLRREVAGSLGFGYNWQTLSPEQQGRVESIVQSGVMQFYYPPPLPSRTQPEGVERKDRPHLWSFLSPLAKLDVQDGESVYLLPENFSGVLGEFTYQQIAAASFHLPFGQEDGSPILLESDSGDNESTRRITVVGDRDIRQLRANRSRSGDPEYCAIRPLESDGSSQSRYEVIFYPTPDRDVTLEYRYSVTPQPLSEDRPWPLCGRQHAESLLQSCLAVAEEREAKGRGAATDRFYERLAASVQLDIASASPTDDAIWPDDGSASSLTIDLGNLERLVGRHMGFGPNRGTWSASQSEQVNEAVRTGLRQFYTPQILPGERNAYEWSFLRPLGSMVTSSGVFDYELPEDFACLDGPLTYDVNDSVLYPEVQLVAEHMIRQKRQRSDYTSRPTMAALRVKPSVDGSGTRWELTLWPTPDGEYTLHFRYRSNPGLLSSKIAQPAGGMPHAQTVIESCLVAADSLLNRQDGTRYKRYMECLRTSVSHDRNVNAADTLGINRDTSDAYGSHPSDWRRGQANVVTYNGVEY